MAEITFGRTPIGQIIYDLGFTKLSDRYLARKHRLPIADIRKFRAIVKKNLKPARKSKRRKARP